MPIEYQAGDKPCAVFAGACTAEEADALLDWLRRTPDPVADLDACGELHTALAQLLLAARIRLVTPPADRLLASCFAAHGLAAAVPSTPVDPPAPVKTRRRPRGKIDAVQGEGRTIHGEAITVGADENSKVHR